MAEFCLGAERASSKAFGFSLFYFFE